MKHNERQAIESRIAASEKRLSATHLHEIKMLHQKYKEKVSEGLSQISNLEKKNEEQEAAHEAPSPIARTQSIRSCRSGAYRLNFFPACGGSMPVRDKKQ